MCLDFNYLILCAFFCVLFVFFMFCRPSVLQMVDTAYRLRSYAVLVTFCQYDVSTLRQPIRRIPSMDTTSTSENFVILSFANGLRYIFIKEHKLLNALLLLQIYMTRRSTNKLIQPQEDPEKLVRSSRKLIKTNSLDSSSSLQL